MQELQLQFFGGEGEGGGGSQTGGSVEAAEAAPQSTPPKRAGRANPLANVHYGKQTETAEDAETNTEEPAQPQTETNVTSDTEVERRAAFEQLIRGEYKDLFGQRMQQVIDTRFKEQRSLQEKQEALQPMLETLAQKYGVEAGDVDKLRQAIEEDDSYYEEEADRKGLNVEQLKAMKKLERENEAFRRAREEQEVRRGVERTVGRWQSEAEETARVYGGFELNTEINSPETGERFLGLLRNGIDVKTAYEVIHKDELLGGAIGYAVQTTQKRTMDNIRARGMRPAENGASGSAPAQTVRSDPSKWTRADREEISRRVRRGERIEL